MGQIGKGAYMFKKNQKWCYRKKAARLLAVFFISSTIATSALGSISHAASKGAADKIMQILSSQDAQLKKQTPLHSAIEKILF